jgi:hypothetical protein
MMVQVSWLCGVLPPQLILREGVQTQLVAPALYVDSNKERSSQCLLFNLAICFCTHISANAQRPAQCSKSLSAHLTPLHATPLAVHA